MTDGFGRTIDYLRISVTDRCNLRCVYCVPEEGAEAVSQDRILSFEEILRLARLFAGLGIRKVKLTGGEPLMRKNTAELAYRLKQISGIEQVTLTTNGVLLAQQMDGLARAGIDGVNLSLDTMNPAVFRRITRCGDLERVMEGFWSVLRYPQIPLKINCVPMGIEGQEVLTLAELAREYPVHVRYIEMMPIGPGSRFDFTSEEVLLAELKKHYGECESYGGRLGNGPGHYYSFPGFAGKIGFISARSHRFCEECSRVRLTAQGYLKTCLQYDLGADLRKLLRGGASDERIVEVIRGAVAKKPAGHQFAQEAGIYAKRCTMAQIGG